jgi:hypothetical protein
MNDRKSAAGTVGQIAAWILPMSGRGDCVGLELLDRPTKEGERVAKVLPTSTHFLPAIPTQLALLQLAGHLLIAGTAQLLQAG